MTTFQDIFKSSFLEQASSFSLFDTLLALILAFVLGLFIFLVYQKTFHGVMYSTGFGVALIGLAMVATLVILAVTSNVVLSLGMVGALSIVRFRSAIKEPLDIVFLFWSIAVGIVLGAGMIPLAVIGSVLVGLTLLFFSNRRSHENPYMLIVHCPPRCEEPVMQTLHGSVRKYALKSKTISSAGLELSIEVRLCSPATDFINHIAALEGVEDAVLVSYNGDYLS